MRRATIGIVCAASTLIALAGPARGQQETTLQMNVYGDITYGVERDEGQTTNTFAVPTFDVFSRGQLGKLSLISEIVFDVPEGNEFQVDVDRAVLSYEFREWFQLSAGRFHTALGYFNTAYPQGAAIYILSVDRPVTVSQFEEQALLPPLGVGLRASGRIHAGNQAFTYDAEVLNGHGPTSAEVVDRQDYNNAKAFNLRLRYEPGFLPGLIVGGNGYVDWIPPSPVDPTTMLSPQPLTLREQIFGAHVAYVEYPVHLILEGFSIQHLAPGGPTFTTWASFIEAGYALGLVTPYFRAELVDFPAAPDPFYALTGQQARGNLRELSFGGKWSPDTSFALKLELEWDHAQTDTALRATMQAAFGF